MDDPREGPHQAWRRLLRGGFAFITAPFAVHPKDNERARQMYHFALHAGISPEEILSEAKAYLEDAAALGGASDEEQLRRVERFLARFKLVKLKRSAWLVFWNRVPASDEADEPSIVAVLDSRKSVGRVADFLEQTYMATTYSLREKMLYASRPKDNPYRAQVNCNYEEHRLVSITCGHNPWLEARIVKNLRLETDDVGRQFLTWKR